MEIYYSALMIKIKKFKWNDAASPLTHFKIYRYIGPTILGKQADVELIYKNGKSIKKHLPADGQVYFLNTGLKHWAENNSNENRIHLIVDTKSQEDLISLQEYS